ncbi:AMT-3 protein [Aphelenchoides avenae]|nr:AMT-3 protein [Aphelenchus avenae]
MAGLLQSSGVAIEPWYDPTKPKPSQEVLARFMKLQPGEIPGMYQNDGMWLVSCGFTIVTMTSGFGLLESGRVSSKDEVNIMVKIIVDVVFGGISYWMFGYGFAFGNAYYRNPFIGLGNFFYSPDDITNQENQAWAYAVFFFQMSFATTTSTVVSAAMAERIRLRPYIVITFLMTIMHSIASHWIWSEDGFLFKLGAIDAAGCAVVHLVGGVAGMVSTIYLGPRQGRFEANNTSTMSNPTNALLGTFMLWWGWLGFNTGSTYGISDGKWKIVGRSAVVTILCSIGGGCTSIIMSLIMTKKCRINWLIDGLLASLVTSTAVVHSIRPAFSVLVGGVGSALALATYQISDKFRIDDPVGVIPVHVVAAIWGMLSVGLFGQADGNVRGTQPLNGLFYSGEFRLLGVQALACAVVIAWAAVMTWISLVGRI